MKKWRTGFREQGAVLNFLASESVCDVTGRFRKGFCTRERERAKKWRTESAVVLKFLAPRSICDVTGRFREGWRTRGRRRCRNGEQVEHFKRVFNGTAIYGRIPAFMVLVLSLFLERA